MKLIKLLFKLFCYGITLCFIVWFCLQIFEGSKNTFQVTSYDISSDKDVSKLRIALITDLHLTEYGRNNSDLLAKLEELRPDLIAVVGDSVTNGAKNYKPAIDFLNKANKIAPTYFSAGNHEWMAIYNRKNTELEEALNNCDATYLKNDLEEVWIGDNKLVICGIYDEGNAYYGLTDDVLTEFNDPKYDDSFKLLLNHIPVLIENSKVRPDADLVLSGHDHGGQIVVPIINRGLYSREQGFFPKYTSGINTIAGNTVIISRGLSNSYHKIPRINNKPEVVVIDVN